jgi:integrase
LPNELSAWTPVASASITARQIKGGGRRFVVRFRRGGRFFPVEHGGSFGTLKEARIRRDLIAGELAAGRDPRDTLRALTETAASRTFAQTFEAFIESRVDVSPATLSNYKTHRDRLVVLPMGHKDPLSLSWQDVQDSVTALSTVLSPASVRIYVGTLRQVLDFAGAEPNPAADKRVKLPRVERTVLEPPSESEVAAIIANAPPKWRLTLRFLEQTGMRAGELSKLEWQDVDAANSRFRIRGGKTASARRWVAVPEWVMDDVLETCPPDDRTPERRVFPGATRQVLGMAMRRGCQAAGLALYSPHDLRHRYASVKVREGVPVTELAAQLGHARKSMTLDTYSHVLLAE